MDLTIFSGKTLLATALFLSTVGANALQDNSAHALPNNDDVTHIFEIKSNSRDERQKLSDMGYALDEIRSDKVFVLGRQADIKILSNAGFEVKANKIKDEWLTLNSHEKEVLPFSLSACDLSLVSILPNVGDTVAPSKMYGILAAGRPVAVIGPKDNYLQEIIEEGDCGECFDNGDAQGLADYICWLQSNSNIQENLGKNARKLLELHYTVDQAIPKYIAALGFKKRC